MGMNHVQKMWAKSNGQTIKGTVQSTTAAVPTPTHQSGGDNKKPVMPESNKANWMTPQFQSKGMSPMQGTGQGDMKPGKTRA